jgi:hypothetical protein
MVAMQVSRERVIEAGATGYRELPLNITGDPFPWPAGFVGPRGTDGGAACAGGSRIDEERCAVGHDDECRVASPGVDVVQVK